MSGLVDLQKALDEFPSVCKKNSSVQIQKHPTIADFKVAVVQCSFCGKKERNDIFNERTEEWEELGKKKALCKTCALKLGKIFGWYNDFKELFSAFQRNLKERALEIDNPSNDYGEVCKQNRQYRTLLKELFSGSEETEKLKVVCLECGGDAILLPDGTAHCEHCFPTHKKLKEGQK